MTLADLLERAKRLASTAAPSPNLWDNAEIDLASNVLIAVQELGDEVTADFLRRTLLQQDYTVTLNSAGVGDPLAAVGSITGVAGEIIQESIRYGVVLDAENNILQPILHYSDFLRPQPTVYGYYTLVDRKIYTRAINVPVTTPADITSAPGPLTITASFVPTSVTNVPSQLEDDLVKKLVAVSIRKAEAPQT